MSADIKNVLTNGNICNSFGDIEEEIRSSFHLPPLRGTGATRRQHGNCCGTALLDAWAACHGLVFSLVSRFTRKSNISYLPLQTSSAVSPWRDSQCIVMYTNQIPHRQGGEERKSMSSIQASYLKTSRFKSMVPCRVSDIHYVQSSGYLKKYTCSSHWFETRPFEVKGDSI